MNNFYFQVIDCFNRFKVEYLVIGGFAVNFYGYNRSTGDMDLWISNDDQNLERIRRALENLNFELDEEAFKELRNERMVSFSSEEAVVELMTRLNISSRVSFQEASDRASIRTIQGIQFRIIALSDLKDEKARSKRYKDLDDLSKLEEAEAIYQRRSKEK